MQRNPTHTYFFKASPAALNETEHVKPDLIIDYKLKYWPMLWQWYNFAKLLLSSQTVSLRWLFLVSKNVFSVTSFIKLSG